MSAKKNPISDLCVTFATLLDIPTLKRQSPYIAIPGITAATRNANADSERNA